jgi:hypothetical protein
MAINASASRAESTPCSSGVDDGHLVAAAGIGVVVSIVAGTVVAGAATVAVVSRHRTKRALKKRKKSGPLGEIVSSNSFLVDIHLLRRD